MDRLEVFDHRLLNYVIDGFELKGYILQLKLLDLL